MKWSKYGQPARKLSNSESGVDRQVVTSAQMYAIEQAAIRSGAVTGRALMERAGQGVVDAILAKWPELAASSRRALVLCGPGNNGGDGYVIARLIATRGWSVSVYALGDPTALPPDAAGNYKKWASIGKVDPIESCSTDALLSSDLVVDALFGTGLKRPFVPPPEVGMAFHRLFADGEEGKRGKGDPRVVAVDIPSGLDADSGAMLTGEGHFVGELAAHLTVTFQRAKLGHVLGEGPWSSGELRVVDIGLEPFCAEQTTVELVGAPERLGKDTSSHKFDHGHALVLSGGQGRSGAARLAARGALRIGAGLVTIAAPASAMVECAANLTAIMLQECEDATAFGNLLHDKRINALCVGPGLGASARTQELVLAALSNAERPVVLDADALSAFAGDPDKLLRALHQNVVLTPHGGEFARLFPDLASKLRQATSSGPAYSKVDAVREAAARARCIVVFKGVDTVIAAPDGKAAVNVSAFDRKAPWLATAGSGDVLAGFVTGLLARNFGPFAASKSAAWLHTECAVRFGPGLISEDLPEVLPAILTDLEL